MSKPQLDLDALIESVQRQAEAPLDQLRVASALAEDLEGLADSLRDHFVAQCRDAGLSWGEVGMSLKVTRQAAQRRFMGRLRTVSHLKPGARKGRHAMSGENHRHSDASREPNWMVAMASTLVDGPMGDLGAVPRMTGGAAGVFTIWYRDQLLFVGHARNAAGEARPSNFGQADGARGRLAGVRRQPPVSVQRALGKFFAQEFKAAPGPNDQKRAAALLERHAKYRMVETSSGPEAVELFGFVQSWLTQQGFRVLADEER